MSWCRSVNAWRPETASDADHEVGPPVEGGLPPGKITGHGCPVVAAALDDEDGLAHRGGGRGGVIAADVQPVRGRHAEQNGSSLTAVAPDRPGSSTACA